MKYFDFLKNKVRFGKKGVESGWMLSALLVNKVVEQGVSSIQG